MPKFLITYEIVTPQSAEHGDAAERGYVSAGFKFPIESVVMARDRDVLSFDLRSAVSQLGCVENAGRWFVEVDGRVNFQNGAETRYSLHPPENITPASYARLCRLLKA